VSDETDLQETESIDVFELIESLIAEVQEAKSVPLSGNILIDRDWITERLQKLQADLPNELRAARWMVREREAFIARTNERAKEIMDRAQSESRRMVSDNHILSEAVEEANILVRRAEGDARRLRLESEDEIDGHLARIETLLTDLLGRVHFARDEFHKARPKSPLPPLD
jgi:regulator of protease activity HflC (stomatin/prohibitin superfamily)